MTEAETLSELVKIAKESGLIVHKLYDGCPDKYYFSTGYLTPPFESKPFYGYEFNLYENQFCKLCKSLKLI